MAWNGSVKTAMKNQDMEIQIAPIVRNGKCVYNCTDWPFQNCRVWLKFCAFLLNFTLVFRQSNLVLGLLDVLPHTASKTWLLFIRTIQSKHHKYKAVQYNSMFSICWLSRSQKNIPNYICFHLLLTIPSIGLVVLILNR